MKNLSVSTKSFFDYSFKGNGKYYTTEQGSRHYNNTLFQNFVNRNEDCVTIIESGNDAPRRGQAGNFVIVEFTEKFYEKYQWYFDAKEKSKIEAIENEEKTKKTVEVLKDFAKENWSELKQLSTSSFDLKQRLNLPIVPNYSTIKKILYSK